MGYHWRDHTEGSALRFNYRGVGSVYRSGEVWRWQLTWNGRVFEGETRNPARQKVWMSRWVSARTGIPVGEILRPREG